jgi:adenylylsulfate kinase
MILILLTGLSGAGKTTLANVARKELMSRGYKAEVIDGDEFRRHICKELSFSKEDRIENIHRLGIISKILVRNGIITFLAAINPYEAVRQELKSSDVKTVVVWLKCSVSALVNRDTKGLYKRAMLPEGDPRK